MAKKNPKSGMTKDSSKRGTKKALEPHPKKAEGLGHQKGAMLHFLEQQEGTNAGGKKTNHENLPMKIVPSCPGTASTTTPTSVDENIKDGEMGKDGDTEIEISIEDTPKNLESDKCSSTSNPNTSSSTASVVTPLTRMGIWTGS